MFIRSIHLSNFKSFKADQIVEFGNKNIIIGKNGSGKSNLLSAIANVFLFANDQRPQYNDNETAAMIKVDINNTSNRFPLPTYFSITVIYKSTIEYLIDDRPVTQDELRGMIENAGFSKVNFVMQGTVNEIALMSAEERYGLLARVAGIEKYEESRKDALRTLDDGNEARIQQMISKIEESASKKEQIKKMENECNELRNRKADLEYKLTECEIGELNEQIEGLVNNSYENINNSNIENSKEEGLIDFEIKECRNNICLKRAEMDEINTSLKRYDSDIINKSNNNSINSLKDKIDALSNKKNIYSSKESEIYIELQALKFLDAMGKSKEDTKSLEHQLLLKKEEIANFNIINSEPPLAERKALWNKQAELKEELKNKKIEEANLSNKILYLGKQSINIYDAIKNENGVCGTVYSLLDVPDELLDAYEAVTRGSLFWIIVENDSVATRLVSTVSGRATFMALNIFNNNHSAQSKIDDASLIRLDRAVKCDPMYISIKAAVCKDFYVAADIKSGIILSEKYNINIVTVEGDVIRKSGVITGGYEQASMVLRELKSCRASIIKMENSLKNSINTNNNINETININDISENRRLENLKAVEKYLTWKIQLNKGTLKNLRKTANVENEYKLITDQIKELNSNQIEKYINKMEKLKSIVNKIEKINTLNKQINEIQNKENSLINSLYANNTDNFDLESKKQKKYLLVDKRSALLKKIGVSDFRNINKGNKNTILQELRSVNTLLKPFYGISSKIENKTDKLYNSDLTGRLNNLQIAKGRILQFIQNLDSKKTETLNLSFSMISANYAYFYRKITEADSALILENKEIRISIENEIVDISSLSGGQKTVVALSLVFAIQKNDPSPFYVFDEIDANLDQNYCRRIYELIKESEAQYFITSFKEDSLACGDRFFGVAVDNKASYIGEIDVKLAAETINF